MLGLRLRAGDALPARIRLMGLAWAMIAFAMVLDWMQPRISATGHVAGFAVGALVTLLLVGRRSVASRILGARSAPCD